MSQDQKPFPEGPVFKSYLQSVWFSAVDGIALFQRPTDSGIVFLLSLARRAEDVAHMVDLLPRMCKALCLNPSTV